MFCIPLLEAISGVDCVPTTGPLGPLGNYFQLIYPRLVGCAGGLTILWSLIVGIQWMTAGGDEGKIAEAKSRFRSVILAYLLFIFAPSVLHFLNPVFFQ